MKKDIVIFPKHRGKRADRENVDNVDKVDIIWAGWKKTPQHRNIWACRTAEYPQRGEKLSTGPEKKNRFRPVDIVDNQAPRRLSPILCTSPAPIVINRSPFMQFFSR